jgi:Uma2 family endonuclease
LSKISSPTGRTAKARKHDFGRQRLAFVASAEYAEYDCVMTVLTKPRMTVDQFLAWAMDQPGRYELHHGEVFVMSPENAAHAEIKLAIHLALLTGIRGGRLPCHVLPDGMTVRIDDTTAYEPDAIVYCGPKIARSAVEVANPMVIVEVLSPSTRSVDLSVKLVGYFRLPSLAHYLIVDPARPEIIHHTRGTGDTFLTRVVTEGSIKLDPPGLQLALADVYSS